MSSNYKLVESDGELLEAMAELAGAPAIAVDTEFIRRDTFFPKAGLIQIADDRSCFLIDPLTITELEPLRSLMLDPAVVKIMHSCSEDLEVFRHYLAVVPSPIFDTQLAAAFCGMPFSMGYQRLVEEQLGVSLDKAETQSDWLRRPLNIGQLGYAADDVVYLPQIYRNMVAHLQSSGRLWWVEEDCAAMVASARYPLGPQLTRLKGAGSLDRTALAYLQALLDWREVRAIKSDKPRTWILSDKQCLAIAKDMSADKNTLATYSSLGRGRPDKFAESFQTMLDEINNTEKAELPPLLPGRPDAEKNRKTKMMKSMVKQWAQEWGVAPEQLLRRKDTEFLAEMSSAASHELPLHLNGWRREAIILPLFALMFSSDGVGL
ncbi:MAG: ribonuclease D [Halieaceae bacterium]|jgi:ribonuclease D